MYVCLNMCSYILRLYKRDIIFHCDPWSRSCWFETCFRSPLHDLTWRNDPHLTCIFFSNLYVVQLPIFKKTSSKTTRPVARITCLSFHSSHGGNTRGARVTFSRCWQQTLPASWCGIPGWEEIFGDICLQEEPKPPAFLSLLSMEKGNMSQLT